MCSAAETVVNHGFPLICTLDRSGYPSASRDLLERCRKGQLLSIDDGMADTYRRPILSMSLGLFSSQLSSIVGSPVSSRRLSCISLTKFVWIVTSLSTLSQLLAFVHNSGARDSSAYNTM